MGSQVMEVSIRRSFSGWAAQLEALLVRAPAALTVWLTEVGDLQSLEPRVLLRGEDITLIG